MKFLLTVILTTLYFLPLFSQNPILREERFVQRENNQWDKVSIVERTFNEEGILISRQDLYFEEVLEEWVVRRNRSYDLAGNVIKDITRSFLGIEEGFYEREVHRTLNTFNQILVEDTYLKEGKNSPLLLDRRSEWEHLADCSTLVRYYERNRATDEMAFYNIRFSLFDENCEFVCETFDNRNISEEDLRKRIRVQYESLRNGKQRRSVEKLACPNEFGCDEWNLKERKTFDKEGRLVVYERGNRTDFGRSVTSYEYLPTQTIRTFERMSRINNESNQTLVSRYVEVIDTSGRFLCSQIFTPLVFTKNTNIYNEEGHISHWIFERTEKTDNGIEVRADTTTYEYEYFCDGLVKSQTTYSGIANRKVEYTYLSPADCGGIIDEIRPFDLFPNPASDLVNLVSEQFINHSYLISIVDAYGKVIYQVPSSRNSNQSVDIHAIPNGAYFLQLSSQDQLATQPFIIAR